MTTDLITFPSFSFLPLFEFNNVIIETEAPMSDLLKNKILRICEIHHAINQLWKL